MKSITGLLLTEDGTLSEVQVKGEGFSHLHSMYDLLDCRTVDCIGLDRGIDLWVDDEFIYTQSDQNLELTLAAVSLGWPGQHIIKGRGLFLTADPKTGASISLRPEQAQRVRDAKKWAEKRVNEIIALKLREALGEKP